MKIQVQGQILPPAAAKQLASGALPGVTVRHAVQVATNRADAAPVELEIQPGQVLEIETEDRAILWLRQDELTARLGASAAMVRGAGAEPDLLVLRDLSLPPSADAPELTRGGLGWAIRRIAVLDSDAAVQDIAAQIEGDDHGLRQWHAEGGLTPITLTASQDKPWLLFIHGTASSTLGSFGKLIGDRPAIWHMLQDLYQGRIIAFDHRSLTQDPVQNAQDLLAALPPGIELHLVTHSRGGLVGELIALARLAQPIGDSVFSDLDLDAFPAAQRPAAEQLGKDLVARAVNVTSFVRVACPARGTSLAGGRLDRWLNLVFNILRLGATALGDKAQDHLRGLHRLALAASASGDSPEALPGVAAMAPDRAPLLRVLNQTRKLKASDRLVVISGDTEPDALATRLALWFADAFFGSDHDLVVNTSSMDGGVPRDRVTVLLDRGDKVNHFSYFSNERTATQLLQALRDPDMLRNTVPTPAERMQTSEARAMTRAALVLPQGAGAEPVFEAPQSPAILRGRGLPLAVILPGTSGSHLGNANGLIWCDPFRLCLGGVKGLAIDLPGIRPYGVIELYYGALRTHLQRTHQTMALAYDWRRPIQETGKVVARLVLERIAEDDQRPVHFIGHSMGGLVARMALLDPRLMDFFRLRADCRLLMLGTPNGGSLAMALALLGYGTTVGALAALSLSQNRADITRILRAWPGAIQLLPPELLNAAAWAALAGDQPIDAAAMAQARDFWRLMQNDAGIPANRTLYLAGMGETCDRLFAVAQGPGGTDLRMTKTPQGDGTVLYATGIPRNVPVWYGRAAHGDLCKDRALHPAITDLLLTGTTSQLPKDLPILRGAGGIAGQRLAEPPEPLPLLPSQPQLLAMAMGGRPPKPDDNAQPAPGVRIRVVHGDLAHARHPLLVGHYLGDPILGAERALDAVLAERLSRRNALGLHPGLIGHWDVHLSGAETGLAGGVVVGMGVMSNLTTGGLTSTIRNGLLAYADAAEDHLSPLDAGAAPVLGISAVLLGSGGGIVSVSDSVLALLNAVEQVNRMLADQKRAEGRPAPQLREIEIIEKVEQVAITAWHAARSRAERMRGGFALDGPLLECPGGYRRIGPETDPDSWMEVTVTASDPTGNAPSANGPLNYLLVDGRARVEAQTVAANRRLVRHFVSQIPQQGGTADALGMSAGRTLFELLWPGKFKQHSLDDRNLRLVLDRESAAIPWEMLDDRRPGEVGLRPDMLDPPAVRFGLLRQLVSQRERAAPRRSGGRQALVIGDPRGNGSPLAELPGAQAEAEEVAALLETAGYTVTRMIGAAATPQDVIAALYSRVWNVVHVASHGVVDWSPRPGEPPMTGIALGAPPLDVLEAPLLAQLPEPPDLFFLNCCHLGQIAGADGLSQALSRDRPGFASSLAVELIERGCPAVVVCGWQIDDAAARIFARHFYGLLFSGADFGTVVKQARQATYAAGGEGRGTTWGAYQCYGHPGFSLFDAPRDLGLRQPEPASPAEVMAVLRAEAQRADELGPAVLLERLNRIGDRMKGTGWDQRADVMGALGDAYLACRSFDLALRAYRVAMGAEVANLPVEALQNALSLPLRLGVADAEDLRRATTALLALNEACGNSRHRLLLLAALYQRQATLGRSSRDRNAALSEMVAMLQAALAMTSDAPSPQAEAIEMRLLLARALRHPGPEIRDAVQRLQARMPPAPAPDPLLQLLAALIDNAPALLPEAPPAILPTRQDRLAEAVDLVLACLPSGSELKTPLATLAQALR